MRFGVLGPVTVQTDDRGIPLPAPAQRALLGLLLLAAGQPVPDQRIIEVLWGEDPPRAARASLHNHALRLRRVLGDPDARLIRRANDGYLLALGDGVLDLAEFRVAAQRGEAAAAQGGWIAAEAALSEALSWWRGAPLADVAAPARAAIGVDHLAEAGLRTREALARTRLRLGRHDQVIDDLGPLIREHPWRESLSGLLMRALFGAGRQADALAVYRDLRTRLVDELGVEPSAAIRDLLQRILRDDPELRQEAAGEPGRPAFGGAGPGGVGGAVRINVPAQLPADLPDFAGRAALAGDLVRLLSRPSAPAAGTPEATRPLAVATITGVGGIGKTSLAVHAAHRLLPRFPDGQLFVHLAGSTTTPRDPSDVLEEMLVALGVDEHDVPAGLTARGAGFRSLTFGRRLLLVLDDARDAAQVRPLLPGSGSCGVVVTSRHRLPALAGAVPVDLDVMGPGEARELFTAIVGASRAEAEPRARDEVLGYCAGLPLAIRIAAARLAARPAWTVADLAARLADERGRLDELSVADLAVRASFQVGYANLGDPDRAAADERARAFRYLGLWPAGDLGLAAIASLLGTEPGRTGRVLESLVDANLVENRSGRRFRLHDLLRIYSRELLQAQDPPGDGSAAVDRLVAWYTHTAAAATDQFFPDRIRFGLDRVPAAPFAESFPSQTSAIEWLRSERTNLRSAVLLAAASGGAAGWVLPAQLTVLYDHCALWTELRDTHTVGLRAAERLDDPVGRARMVFGLRIAAGHLGGPVPTGGTTGLVDDERDAILGNRS